MATRGRGKGIFAASKMIVEFDSGFGFAGALAMAFHFEMFVFAALAFELRIVELLLFIQPSQWIVESSSDRRDFVASFGVRIRPPRKPPDKFRHSDSCEVRSLADC